MSNDMAVLKQTVQNGLKPIDQIPSHVLETQVSMFLTRKRLMSVGAEKVQAEKIVTSLLRFREEKMKNLIEKHLHLIPKVGKVSLTHIIAAINAAI